MGRKESNQTKTKVLLVIVSQVQKSKLFKRKIVIIFLPIWQLKHVFWVLKRIVSLRWFFWVPTTYVSVEK